MQIVVGHISDFHLQERVRFNRTLSVLRNAANVFRDKSVDIILITGDLAGKDSPHRYTYQERMSLMSVIGDYADIAPVFVIRGNHDCPGEIPIFRYLNRKHPVVTADSSIIDVDLEVRGQGVTVFLHPWIPVRSMGADMRNMSMQEAQDYVMDDVIEPWLRSADPKRVNILASHSPTVGAEVRGFILPSVRDFFYTKELLSEINFDYVGIGHIHERQEIAPGCWYVGTPYPTDYSEDGERGVHIVTISCDGPLRSTSLELVPLESFKLVHRRVSWTEEGGFAGEYGDDPLHGLSSDDIDDNFFKFTVEVPYGTLHSKVPWYSKIFMPIFSLGGDAEVKIKAAPPPSVSLSPSAETKTLPERLMEIILKSTGSEEDAVRCMDLYEELSAS